MANNKGARQRGCAVAARRWWRVAGSGAVRWAWVAVLGLAMAPAAEARFTPQPCNDAYSEQQELELGRKAAAQVYKQMPVLPDNDPLTNYVRSIGRKLQAVAPGEKWPFEFHVVNSGEINAFALPGGPMFVNLGAIQAADTEAQLAGVMAHEMSHVIQRHATCNATKEQKQGALYGILGAIAGAALGGTAGQVAQAGVGLGAGLHFLTYSRTAEKQADLMGTDMLYDAGYDPRALPQFFETIQAKYGSGGAQFLSDHPNPGNRIEYVNAEIATLPARRNFISNTNEFRQIHERAAHMHAYTAEEIKAGGWRNGSQYATGGAGGAAGAGQETRTGPARVPTFGARNDRQAFAHSRYTINYPADWRLSGDASSSVNTIAPVGGVDANDNLACGVLIGNAKPQGGGTLTQQMRALEQSIEQQDPNMRQVEQDDDVTVNGLNGRSAEFVTRSPLSTTSQVVEERDWLVAIELQDGGLTYLVFAAPSAQFDALRPVFESMLRTFEPR